MVHTGDCVEVMAGMDAASVDAIVTDPPYGLEFMGKEWDRLWTKRDGKESRGRGRDPFTSARVEAYVAGKPAQEFHQRWATEALRVARPGAYLLAFGGTRTYHRMACAIEDAGWIIRDCLVWAYASGFPKSRALLKPAWEPIVMARKPGPLRELAIDACRIATGDETIPRKTGKGILGGSPEGGYDRPWKHDADALARRQDRADVAVEAANVLGRWPANLILTDPIFDGDTPGVVGGGEASYNPAGVFADDQDGGWPGGTRSVFGYGDSGTYSRFFLIPKADRAEREPILPSGLEALRIRTYEGGEIVSADHPGIANGGRATRANVHPTVKPLDLMRHLVRLVTPTGGVVLDPFLGSGTTALAAEMEGFGWVGIEREAEYVAIAEARLNGTQRGLGLAV